MITAKLSVFKAKTGIARSKKREAKQIKFFIE
jgi:hypothetical protein